MTDAKAQNRMWGGRFAEGPDAIMEEINASIGFDKRLAAQDIEGSRAHARMLAATGVITDSDADQICDGLLTVLSEIEGGTFQYSRALEDIHMNVEARLTEICTWLGVSYSPAMLSFHEQPLTAANAERVGAWENLSKPLLSDNAGRYRDELSENEIRHIETTCRDQMAFFGYPPDFEAAPERARDVAAAVEALEAEVAARVEDVAASERELRSRRQAAIDRILARNLDAARPGADTE